SDSIGILLRMPGIARIASSNSTPWDMADNLVLAPALIFAVVLTITEVIGSPPIIPEIMLPMPCAFSSLLGLEYLFLGSILSPASRQSNVSMLATTAIV